MAGRSATPWALPFWCCFPKECYFSNPAKTPQSMERNILVITKGEGPELGNAAHRHLQSGNIQSTPKPMPAEILRYVGSQAMCTTPANLNWDLEAVKQVRGEVVSRTEIHFCLFHDQIPHIQDQSVPESQAKLPDRRNSNTAIHQLIVNLLTLKRLISCPARESGYSSWPSRRFCPKESPPGSLSRPIENLEH